MGDAEAQPLPLVSFAVQLEEEIEAFEWAQPGSFQPIVHLAGLDELLVGKRIHLSEIGA